jgi:hypothetical protein
MEQLVFSVYDSKAEAYMQPFFMNTKGQALRVFQDSLEDNQSQLSKHPEDFTLFQIGTFNQQNASLIPLKTPISLGTAIELSNR